MTIEEIKDIVKDIPEGSKGLAMGHPINEDVNYHLQQLLLKWEFDTELLDEVLTALERKVETIREYCLSKRGVTESFPFDDVSLVIKVMNKMFALIDLEEANHIALKCDPEKAIELREHYSGIEGAYHFNKKYWNSVRFDSDVDDKLMKELIDHSYDEVIKKFTKKLRAEYDALP